MLKMIENPKGFYTNNHITNDMIKEDYEWT